MTQELRLFVERGGGELLGLGGLRCLAELVEVLPGSLRSVADVRAARTKKKSAPPVGMTELADGHAENEEGTIYRAPTEAGETQEVFEQRIKERLKEGALSQ